ncbi:MAG: ADP-ribosylglycohydrolase [Methanosaeta sp. NSM2]|nr:MAG: ADP-ribosylglycohydrolase [Methanosaeta sp. NSM2]
MAISPGPHHLPNMQLLDRFRGCLLGGAAGDALGMPTEGYTAQEIRSRFGPIREMMAAPEGHFHSGLKAGQFTDDTEETLLLAESLTESCGFSAERFAERLASWGSNWTLDERQNRGVGFVTRSAVESLITGTRWQQSGLSISTCGSAMRAAPIGLLYHFDLTMARSYADLQSLPTHISLAARAASVAVAVGVALALHGFSKEAVVQGAASWSSRLDGDFGDKLLYACSLRDLPAGEALELIRTSPLAIETVPAAFYCYQNFDAEEGLITAAGGGGDTDSIASIAGSLFGASQGVSWIPRRWLEPLEGKDRIEDAARGLWQLSASFCR